MIVCDKCRDKKEEALELFGYHFCNDCKDDLNVVTIHWVMEMCEFSEAKKKNLKFAKPVSIDWDKACALKLAGWSIRQIADELGANAGSIGATIGKKVEMYKHGMRWGAPLPKEEDEDDWIL